MSSLQNNALQAATSTELLRSSRGAGNFVGADSSDTRNFLGYTDAGSSTGQRSSARTGTGTSRNGATSRRPYSAQSMGSNRQRYGTTNRSRSNQTASEFQPTLSLGFDYRPPADVATKITARLQQSKRLALPPSVRVEVQDGTATLVGLAASQHDRQLIEQMLALEPGIRRVENRLTVSPPAPASSPPAQ